MEITTRTHQSRYLLRPSEALNRLFVGVLAKALQHHNVKLHAVVVMSTHYHLIASPENVKELSDFMRFVNGQLSSEVGRIHDWRGGMWHRRFASIPISDETEAQVARLKYVLSNSCKEGLVLSPHDWPGVHCAGALVEGEPLRGVWIDRTGYHRARECGKDVELSDFEEHLEIHLEPLPCWEHLDEATWRGYVADLVKQVEEDTLAMHRSDGTVPTGTTSVLRVDPHQRKAIESRSPKPRFHAFRKEVRRRMTEAWARWVEAYVEAAEQLRVGLSQPRFPPDCHPPPLPHVPAVGST